MCRGHVQTWSCANMVMWLCVYVPRLCTYTCSHGHGYDCMCAWLCPCALSYGYTRANTGGHTGVVMPICVPWLCLLCPCVLMPVCGYVCMCAHTGMVMSPHGHGYVHGYVHGQGYVHVCLCMSVLMSTRVCPHGHGYVHVMCGYVMLCYVWLCLLCYVVMFGTHPRCNFRLH